MKTIIISIILVYKYLFSKSIWPQKTYATKEVSDVIITLCLNIKRILISRQAANDVCPVFKLTKRAMINERTTTY